MDSVIYHTEYLDLDSINIHQLNHTNFNNDIYLDGAISKMTNNVYITIDLDVFDPAIMPSTGTPEPGGLRQCPAYAVVSFV